MAPNLCSGASKLEDPQSCGDETSDKVLKQPSIQGPLWLGEAPTRCRYCPCSGINLISTRSSASSVGKLDIMSRNAPRSAATTCAGSAFGLAISLLAQRLLSGSLWGSRPTMTRI